MTDTGKRNIIVLMEQRFTDFPGAAEYVKELIENERPKGNWIVTAQDNEGIHRIQCSCCGYERGSDFSDYITVTFDTMPPFCEKCGADLRGVKDE